MGQDKADISFAGATLLEHVAARLSGLCEEIVIAGADRPRQGLGTLDPVWAPDPPGAVGPLAGLAAGLGAASHSTVVLVACDMPFISLDLLRQLLDLIRDSDAAIPLVGGRPQPLHAAYSRRCLPAVRSLLETGARSMYDLLERLDVEYLGEQECAALDPEGRLPT
jgi:molybdopterin-guanine dinucleotide biosynthesis protein A